VTPQTPYRPQDYTVPGSPPGFYPPQQAYRPARRRPRWQWVVGTFMLIFALVGAAFALRPEPRAAQAALGRMNAPSADGALQFTVTRVTCGVPGLGLRRAQGRYCLVDVTVRNVGSAAAIFDGSAQKAYDERGSEFAHDSSAAPYADPVNPGNRLHGRLAFDVPAGTRLAAVVLHTAASSAGVRVPLGLP
jgi:hypothetical protein